MKPRGYHHGDLRAALVKAGLELLATRTADDLSLRELARAVGVSANAVYRHFEDKGALMAALAAEGLQMLADSQQLASAEAGGGGEGFHATGRAYVHFAIENPALFRLIFSSPARQDLLSEPPETVPDAMRLLRVNAMAAGPEGADPTLVALRAWSQAHGLAMLMLDGKVQAGPGLIEKIFP